MRELKFRAWLKKEKRMVDVVSINFKDKTLALGGLFIMLDKMYYYNYPFEDIELMQYIGHNDINNKEIFEDDLVKDENGAIYRVVYNEQDGQYVYLYVHEQDIIGAWHDVEVIGNVWENGELVGENNE